MLYRLYICQKAAGGHFQSRPSGDILPQLLFKDRLNGWIGLHPHRGAPKPQWSAAWSHLPPPERPKRIMETSGNRWGLPLESCGELSKYIVLVLDCDHPQRSQMIPTIKNVKGTSSTAQGGGGSFKNRKPIGEIGCCESGMAERSHWRTEKCLRSPLFLSFSLTIYLPTYLPIYLCIYLSLSLSLSHLITYLSSGM